jgi:hypothetical protein
MLSHKLITFGKKLSQDFVKHIESTPNLCAYKLGSYYIPDSVIFPKAESLTLINCNRHGILNILTPIVFPNLTKVNYLSADPGDFKIYERFNDKLKWVFPNKTYEFYDFMLKTGRGTKDSHLIKKYVASKKIIDGKNEFDISFHFDLNIPGFGIIDGEWWHSQFYEYLVNKQNIMNNNGCPVYPDRVSSIQDDEEKLLQKEYVKLSVDEFYFDSITDNDD